jgi:hypothetical protein
MPSSAPGGERLSSAILYAAIVAIWAGVLIPRWLRRDSSSSSSSSDAPDALGEHSPDETAAEDDQLHPPPRRMKRRDGRRREDFHARREDFHARREDPDARREVPRDLGHRQALAARRRLLGLLLLLAAGSGALAGTRMAAWWVVVPPSVMLLGYLPLLRAAARADAERRVLAARHRSATGPVADYSRDLTDPVTYVAHVAPLRDPAPAPAAEAVGIPDGDEEIYDQYADAKLRAVGD